MSSLWDNCIPRRTTKRFVGAIFRTSYKVVFTSCYTTPISRILFPIAQPRSQTRTWMERVCVSRPYEPTAALQGCDTCCLPWGEWSCCCTVSHAMAPPKLPIYLLPTNTAMGTCPRLPISSRSWSFVLFLRRWWTSISYGVYPPSQRRFHRRRCGMGNEDGDPYESIDREVNLWSYIATFSLAAMYGGTMAKCLPKFLAHVPDKHVPIQGSSDTRLQFEPCAYCSWHEKSSVLESTWNRLKTQQIWGWWPICLLERQACR